MLRQYFDTRKFRRSAHGHILFVGRYKIHETACHLTIESSISWSAAANEDTGEKGWSIVRLRHE